MRPHYHFNQINYWMEKSFDANMEGLKGRVSSLFNSEALSDVHFLVWKDSQQLNIPAHKLILSIGSPIFKSLFNNALGDKTEVIEIPDVEPTAFLALLRYLYSDEINIKTEDVIETLHAAQKYKVSILEKACVNFLESNLQINNAFMVISQAKQLNDTQLLNLCFEKIDENTSEALKSEYFLNIDVETLCELLDRSSLRIQEFDLFQAVLRWSKAECNRKHLIPVTPENQRAVLEPALNKIRFPLMTIKEFALGPVRSSVLTNEENVKIFTYFALDEKPEIPYVTITRGTENLRSNVSSDEPPVPRSDDPLILFNTEDPKQHKVYDRKILIHLQTAPLSLRKPKNLPHICIIKDKPIIHVIKDSFDFSSSKLRSLITEAYHEQFNNKGFKRYVLAVLNERASSSFEFGDEDELKNLCVDSKHKLETLVSVIYEKALEQPRFSIWYARLCQQLKMRVTIDGNTEITFKSTLLRKCKSQFERDSKSKSERIELVNAITFEESKENKMKLNRKLGEINMVARRRPLENIRFIGDLFRYDLLSPAAIYSEYIVHLQNVGDEDSLEWLCILLTSIGRKFEKKNNYKEILDDLVVNLINKHTSDKILCMAINLFVLRTNMWIPCTDDEVQPSDKNVLFVNMPGHEVADAVCSSVENYNNSPESSISGYSSARATPDQDENVLNSDIERPKLNRKEDQRSLIDIKGIRQYDRRLLKQLRDAPLSLQKPEGLPDLCIIKDEPNTHSMKDSDHFSQYKWKKPMIQKCDGSDIDLELQIWIPTKPDKTELNNNYNQWERSCTPTKSVTSDTAIQAPFGSNEQFLEAEICSD